MELYKAQIFILGLIVIFCKIAEQQFFQELVILVVIFEHFFSARVAEKVLLQKSVERCGSR